MPALDDYDARTELDDSSAGLAHGLDRSDLHLGQHFGLRDVWRHDMRERQQLGSNRLHGVLGEQPVASLGDHDGIDDELWEVKALHRCSDRFDDRGVGEHPGLDGVDADVSHYRLDLRGHQIRRNRLPFDDAERVLGSDRRDRTHTVDAVRGKGFQVGLDARPAA